MSLRTSRLAGVAAASVGIPIVLLAAAAHAQPAMPTIGPPGPLDPDAAQGPLERRMIVRAQARAVYDNAITRGLPPATPGQNQRHGDVLYSPNAEVDVFQPIGPAYYGFAQGNVGYEFYHREPKLNSARVGVASGVGGSLGPCQGSLAGNYGRGQSNTEDLTLGVTRNVQQSVGAQFSGSCPLIAGTQVQFGANYSRSTNSAARGTVDNEGYGVSAGVGYGNRALGSISLIGQYQVTAYDRGPLLGPGIPGNSETKTYNVGLQYSRPIGRKLVGSVNVGYAHIDSGPLLPTNETLSANVNLSYTPTRRLRGSFSYRRSFDPSALAGINYTINEGFRLSLSYRLSQRLRASGGVGYNHRINKGVVDPNLLGAPASEETPSFFAALGASIGRKSTVSLDASYKDRSTDVPSLSYDSIRIGITASTSF